MSIFSDGSVNCESLWFCVVLSGDFDELGDIGVQYVESGILVNHKGTLWYPGDAVNSAFSPVGELSSPRSSSRPSIEKRLKP